MVGAPPVVGRGGGGGGGGGFFLTNDVVVVVELDPGVAGVGVVVVEGGDRYEGEEVGCLSRLK